MNTSSEMISGPDLFLYYIHGVSDLLSRDAFLPSSLKNTRLVGVGNGSIREKEESEKNRPFGFGSMFSNAIGNRLTGHEKTRLLTILHQSVISLNREVDEMLDPVFSMHRLKALMGPTKRFASYQDVNGKVEIESARKRLKVSSTSSPVIVESLCGDCSKHANSESFLGSSSRDDKENGEVNDDLQVLLVNRGPKVIENMEKHSAELSAMLSRMEEKIEELLSAVTSSCRPMSLVEKHQLRRLIEKLPPQNLDRVVEIIRGKPPEKQSNHDITVDLMQEDDLRLWRIYFYVKAVESAQKLF